MMLRIALIAGGLAAAATGHALAQDADRSDWPSSFTVGTASQGGTYFVYGSGWANLVSEALGVPGGAEVTGGPVQNASLVQSGDMEMGMVTMGPAAEAIAGESPESDVVRVASSLYPTRSATRTGVSSAQSAARRFSATSSSRCAPM